MPSCHLGHLGLVVSLSDGGESHQLLGQYALAGPKEPPDPDLLCRILAIVLQHHCVSVGSEPQDMFKYLPPRDIFNDKEIKAKFCFCKRSFTLND